MIVDFIWMIGPKCGQLIGQCCGHHENGLSGCDGVQDDVIVRNCEIVGGIPAIQEFRKIGLRGRSIEFASVGHQNMYV